MTSRIKLLISATCGAVAGYACAMARSIRTTSIAMFVPWSAGEGCGGAAAAGVVGAAGGAPADESIPGGGVSGGAAAIHQTFLWTDFRAALKCGFMFSGRMSPARRSFADEPPIFAMLFTMPGVLLRP